MQVIRSKQMLSLLVAGVIGIGAAAPAAGVASPPSWPSLTGVPTANTRSDGYAPASKLSPELRQVAVAQGATRLENPSPLTSFYGYDNDVLNAAGNPQMVPIPANPTTEAHKTEPDENTYFVFKNGLDGADPGYDYDSGYVWDVTKDYSNSANQPVRWLAEGRDASATIDAANGGFGKNDGDNEITGAIVSDGDTGTDGILGAQIPNLGNDRWRWFYTQQHGDNRTYEVTVKDSPRDD
jgi:hypothetical protein